MRRKDVTVADQQLLAQQFEEQRPHLRAVTPLVVGAAQVAGRARMFSRPGVSSRHALVNGAGGLVSWQDGRLVAVLGFTIAHDKIVAIDVLADPERLSRLDGVER
jgi:hypothetical protein